MTYYQELWQNPDFIADITNLDLKTSAIVRRWDVSATFVKKHRSLGTAADGQNTETILQTKETSEQSTDGSRSIQFIRERPVTLEDAREWIRSTGDDPEDYTISVRSIAYGQGQSSNRMAAIPKPGRLIQPDQVLDVDAVSILAELRKTWKPGLYGNGAGGNGAFVLSINDTQFGKHEGAAGTPETLARFDKILTLAKWRINELRKISRPLGTLVIIGGGDLVEGCAIYGNQSYNLDLDRRGQINTAVTVILDTIDRLAPMFERVIVLAARGNHGENRINGNKTTLYDNDDTLVFEMAERATSRDESLQHVEYIIAQDEAGVWADVAGWRLATTHGDIYGKGVPGASIDKKAQNWYKNMSMARDPLGLADVLITHHYHHEKSSDWGACEWHQTPALDNGSEYFRQSTGEYSLPGMLTFVMTTERRYQDEMVLR